MSSLSIPSVRAHLNALGESPEWIHRLGEAIQAVTGCDAALAALRARDLASHPALAGGLAQYTSGWLALAAADRSTLTPLQQETLAAVLGHIHRQIQAQVNKEQIV